MSSRDTKMTKTPSFPPNNSEKAAGVKHIGLWHSMIIALVQVSKQNAQENRQKGKLILLEGDRFLEAGLGEWLHIPPVREE